MQQVQAAEVAPFARALPSVSAAGVAPRACRMQWVAWTAMYVRGLVSLLNTQLDNFATKQRHHLFLLPLVIVMPTDCMRSPSVMKNTVLSTAKHNVQFVSAT